jgi:WD repeat-containing protein 48
MVASGGLGREVFIWDLEAAMTPLIRANNEATEEGSFEAGYASGDRAITSNNLVTAAPPQNPPQGYAPVPAKGHKESVYALAMNDAGTILVSGGTEKAVRVWDPRSGAKQMKLKGHTDNVRALLLDPTGRLCLSGSSDSMIRLWDLGQQRCIHSYAVHTDSVWALASTPSFSHVYSGGRDFSVYLTDLNTRESTLLCKEEHPVLRLALQGDEWLWVATTDSSLHKWPARERSVTKALQRASSFVAGSLPFARARANIDGSAPVPLYTQPTSVIPGTAGIVQHAILNDRRHVLTKDAAGIVKRWEITRGAVIEDYGKVNFEEKEKELFEMVSVPAWFTMDTRLGSMSVHLDTPQCFSAEMYAVDLNVPNASEELKLNIGQETLKGLLAHWLSQRRASTNKALPPTQASPNGDVSPSLSSGAGDLGSNRRTGLDDAQHEANPQQLLVSPAFEFSTESPPSIITEGSHGGPWRKKATELNGTEDENKLPWWCIECVLHGRLSQRENAKCSFYLHPQQGQTITVLTQGKLSAPRILRIHKVKNYVLEKLILERPLEETGPESNASAGQSGNQPGGGNSNGKGAFRPGTRPWPQGTKPVVEILCNDQVLPPEMSLATVRTYVWKKPEDLYLHYRTVTTPSSSSSR